MKTTDKIIFNILSEINKKVYPDKLQNNKKANIIRNKLIDELILLDKKSNLLEKNSFKFGAETSIYSRLVDEYFSKINIPNVDIDRPREDLIQLKYKCNKAHYMQNIFKNIRPLNFIDIRKGSYYFYLMDFKFKNNRFFTSYYFEHFIGENKFISVIKNIESEFLKSEFVDLYTKYQKNKDKYMKLNNKLTHSYNESRNINLKIKELELISKISKCLIYHNDLHKIKIVNFKINKEKVYLVNLNTNEKSELSFREFYIIFENKKMNFDKQSLRSFKFNEITNII